jgi:hypothetical protein
LALLLCGAVCGEEPKDKNAVFAEVKAALAREDVDRTEMEGFTLRNTLFSDSAKEGGVLIGFDLGIGVNDVIFALRPIYLTAKGEAAGRDLGRFSTGGRQDKVKRVVQVKAKPGYAVAKVRFQSAITIQCIRLTYSRLSGLSLDPSDSYSTNWIGVFKRERDEKVLDSLNSPVVGVFGNQDDKVVLALGLIHLKEMPVEDPSRVREYAFPKKDESEAAKSSAEAGAGDESTDAPSEEGGGSGISWLPFVVFGVVAVPMFLVMMLVLGKKKQPEVAERPRRARPRKEPPQDEDSEIPLVHPVDGEESQQAEEALQVEEPQKADEAPKFEELQKAVEPQLVEEAPKIEELQKTEEPLKVEEQHKVEDLPKETEVQKTEVTPKVETVQKINSRRLDTADYRRATNSSAAAKKEEAALVGPADPHDPYWNSEELMQKAVGPREPSSGASLASVFIGAVALFFWCLPILGVPISITGLVFGIVGLNSSRPGKAVLGVVLNGLGLLFAIINGAVGVYLAMKKHGMH